MLFYNAVITEKKFKFISWFINILRYFIIQSFDIE